ncbi:zinc-dependent metalloprotease [Moheibacter stercoris]|uniref:Secretion system C-terminal sorting domain-containing protein n=1 Tax=Moheibacter stercoris TaxID=1628251 RepID=A0ABV2LT98_9FLAO
MKKVLLALAIASPIFGFSQWKSTTKGSSVVKEGKERIEAAGVFSLDMQVLKQRLANTPERFSNLPGNIITIPNAKGEMEKFEVWEASNFSPVLQAKFPEIRSYMGTSLSDPHAYLRISVSPAGVSSMVLRNGKSEFIEPYTTDGQKYIVFDSKKHRQDGEMPFKCETEFDENMVQDSQNFVADKSSAGVFKTFRLAQAVTGEYSAYFGGTLEGAMGGINATLTRVNGVFEKDFAINLILIDNNDEIVFLNPSTDPFTQPGNIGTTQGQLQSYLNANIGAANYDIGHIYHRSGGGGSAGCIGCICIDANKGRGYTSPGSGGPEGDYFDIDYVAHEYGHQLGANHTFSHNIEGTGVNIEPGSGSTIMGYAGITSYNVQQHSDDYFTYRSIQQVQNNLQNKPCANNTTIANVAPVVDAGSDYEIPKGTAFKLTGSATDGNGDPLIYTWEQNDNATGSNTGANSRVSWTKTTGPNFRSVAPSTEPVRYMPRFDYVLLTDVITNENYWRGRWEAVTTVPRTFNFTLTARDNNAEAGQTGTDAMRVYVRDAGPFKVNTPASGQNVDISANTMLVEWDVAGTNAAPINTANVRILFSSDNGATFTVVAESTPNDGSEMITIPTGTVAGVNGRIMIEAIDNIYYAVSRKFNLTGTMGVSDLNQLAIGIYPNPTNGQFNVAANNVAKGNVKTTIFDTAGKMVHVQNDNHAGGNLNIAYNVKLPTGTYVVNIETAEGLSTTKLLVK